MRKTNRLIIVIFILLNFGNYSFAENNFFEKGKKKYDEQNYEDNKKEEQKNIDTVLLLDPKNEEANYMLMEIELKRSNYSKVKELADNFSKICNKLCDKENSILESLKNLEPKNDS